MSEAVASGDPAVRVFVLHSDRLLIEALERALADRKQLRLVGASARPLALESLLEARPDVVLIDASRERRVVLATVRELKEAVPQLDLVPFGLTDREEILDFIEAGANGYVPAEASLAELVAIVEAVSRGEAPCSSGVAAGAVKRLLDLSRELSDPHPSSPLTPREGEVLALVGRGLSNKEIAGALGIALSTVKNHVHSILGKIGVSFRREAVRQAYESGWIDRCLPSLPPRDPRPSGPSLDLPSLLRSIERE